MKKRRKYTRRGMALHWLTLHRGCNEQPPNSNRDNRKDGITAAQRRLADYLVGLAWCGVWFANALIAAGVKGAHNPLLASVAWCEDQAKRGQAPFRGWITTRTRNWHKLVLRGDGVILFGRGHHIETVRSVAWRYRVRGYILTDGGNTTAEGQSGDQANGGTSAARKRPISAIYGFPLVDYPNE